jgi:hypothetical protein
MSKIFSGKALPTVIGVFVNATFVDAQCAHSHGRADLRVAAPGNPI